MLKKYFTILILLIIAVGTISAVSAGDVAETADVLSDSGDINENLISEDVNEQISTSDDVVNEEITASDDVVNEEISVSEEIVNEDLSADTSADDVSADDVISVKEDNKKALGASENNQVLGAQAKTDDVVKAVNNEAETLAASNSNQTVFKITYLGQSGKYASNKKVKIKVTDSNGTAVANAKIFADIYRSNGNWETMVTVKTNANGIGYITFKDVRSAGTYKIISAVNAWDTQKYGKNAVCNDYTLNNVKIYKEPVSVRPARLVTYYNSGKTFNVRILNSQKKPVARVHLKVKLYVNGRYKTLSLVTNSKGLAQYKSASRLNVGTHKAIVTVNDNLYSGKSVSSYVKVVNNVIIKSQYVKVKQNNDIIGGVLVVGVLSKKTKSLTNNIPVTIKIRNGRGYKTLKLVTGKDADTNNNGIVGYATNMLSAGTHSVKIIVNNRYYKGTANAKFIIPSQSKRFQKWYMTFSRGKSVFRKY